MTDSNSDERLEIRLTNGTADIHFETHDDLYEAQTRVDEMNDISSLMYYFVESSVAEEEERKRRCEEAMEKLRSGE